MLKMTFWKEDSPKIKTKRAEGKIPPMCQYISNGQWSDYVECMQIMLKSANLRDFKTDPKQVQRHFNKFYTRKLQEFQIKTCRYKHMKLTANTYIYIMKKKKHSIIFKYIKKKWTLNIITEKPVTISNNVMQGVSY